MPKNYSELTAIGRALVNADLIPMWGTAEGQTRRCTYGDIATPLQTQIDTNTANIATNASNISANSGDITTNTADIAQNTADIAQNTLDIETNTTGLTTKVEGPAGATPDNLMVFNGASGYVAKDGGVTIATLQADIDSRLQTVASDATLTGDGTAGSPLSVVAAGGASALDDLSDVTITTPADTQVLRYNGSQWVNSADTGGGGGATQLSELSDVTSAAQTAGFVLASSGAAYAGRALIESDIPSAFLTATEGNAAYAPIAHAASHADGGSDELDVADLASGSATNGQVPKADGAGGVAWGDDESGGTGGGLTNVSVTGNATAVVGNNYLSTPQTSGATYTITLPDPAGASEGDIIGCQCLEDTTTQSLIIANFGGAEFTRLISLGEAMQFKVSGGVWTIWTDDRRPFKAKIYLTTSLNTLAAASTLMLFDKSETSFEVGGCADTTNNRILIRREASIESIVQYTPAQTPTVTPGVGDSIWARTWVNGSPEANGLYYASKAVADITSQQVSQHGVFAGDYVQGYCYLSNAGFGLRGGSSNAFLTIKELL